jgi:uncharacterized protein (DUF305 family)
MSTKLFPIGLVALLLLGSTNAAVARAQTPVASPADQACSQSLESASASPSAEATAVTIDLASLEFDQIAIDLLLPRIGASIDLAAVIHDRTRHPPVVGYTEVLIQTQSPWIGTLTALRDQTYPDSPDLTDEQLATALEMATANSPGMGASANQFTASADLEAMVGDLCAEGADADLRYMDLVTSLDSELLVLSSLTEQNATHSEMRDLATAMVAEISAEVDQINLWRSIWYGEASPGPDAKP